MNPEEMPPVYKDCSNNRDDSTRYDPRAKSAADFAINELQVLADKSLNETTQMLKNRQTYMTQLEEIFKKSYPISSNSQNQTDSDNEKYITNMRNNDEAVKVPLEKWIEFNMDWCQRKFDEIKEPKKKSTEKTLRMLMLDTMNHFLILTHLYKIQIQKKKR